MSLRQRIVLTLLAITAVLVAPAVYGYFVLRDLRDLVGEIRTRDTGTTALLGRISTDIEELDYAQSSFVVFESGDTAAIWQAQADSAIARIAAKLDSLRQRPGASPAFRRRTLQAIGEFGELRAVIAEERERVRTRVRDPNSVFRNQMVGPAFREMEESLDPISDAVDEEGEQKVQRAREVAARAGTTTLVALLAALLLTLLIGAWLARGLLRPIQELRNGMAHVAEGDFAPDVRVPVERPDEIGDLARSFGTMTAQLAELDRLKAEFVSVASHEIKTPLSVIRGYVSLLADGIYGEVSNPQKKTLGSISDQVDRLTRLVHRLLDISRFEAGGGRLEIRRINVRDFLAELTGGFDVLAFQNGIDFRVRVADDVPVNLEGDADRLNEVLGNLLSNAFKFTPRGGSIRLDASRNGAGIVVEVEDSGVGIPPDKLPRIFEKFYQVENEAQPRSVGSGLGLAIAREIVEAHGGMIGAESRVGQGTRFTVTLPERPPAHRLAEPHPAPERR